MTTNKSQKCSNFGVFFWFGLGFFGFFLGGGARLLTFLSGWYIYKGKLSLENNL